MTFIYLICPAFLKIYFFERLMGRMKNTQTHTHAQKGGQGGTFIHLFNSEMVAVARAEHSQSQVPHSSLSHGWQAPKHLSHLPLLSPTPWQRVELEMEQVRNKPVPIWDASVAGSSFIHYSTTPASYSVICFLNMS